MENPFLESTLFVGRKTELARMTKKLARGQSTLLIGGRRAGKTTLLRQIRDIGRRIVRVDASEWPLHSEEVIIRAISLAIGSPMESSLTGSTQLRERFTELLEAEAPVCLIIDEADRILGEPWAGSFLSFLRWLDDSRLQRRISFLLAGGPMLASYRNPDDLGSPPLNTADPVHLEPLDEDAIWELVAVVENAPPCEEIRKLVGGHPWLLVKLLSEIWDGATLEEATEQLLDISIANFKVWMRQLGEDGVQLLKKIPPTGLFREEFARSPWISHRESYARARFTCLVHFRHSKVYSGSSLFLSWLQGENFIQWDLAISYASEDENIARAIWSQLRRTFRVFFAPEEKAWMWGENLNKVLPNTYGVNSRYVLILSTQRYVQKQWTIVEFNAALKENPNKLLIVNFGALPSQIPEDLVYQNANSETLVYLIESLRNKLIL